MERSLQNIETHRFNKGQKTMTTSQLGLRIINRRSSIFDFPSRCSQTQSRLIIRSRIYIYTWPHTLEYIHTLATRRPYALVYFHTFPSLLFLFKTSLEKKKTPKQTQRCRSNPQECPTRWRSTFISTRGRSTISSSSSTANTVQSSIRF